MKKQHLGMRISVLWLSLILVLPACQLAGEDLSAPEEPARSAPSGVVIPADFQISGQIVYSDINTLIFLDENLSKTTLRIPSTGQYYHPEFSAEGKRLVFACQVASGTMDQNGFPSTQIKLCEIPVDSSGSQDVSSLSVYDLPSQAACGYQGAPAVTDLDWLPDQEQIAIRCPETPAGPDTYCVLNLKDNTSECGDESIELEDLYRKLDRLTGSEAGRDPFRLIWNPIDSEVVAIESQEQVYLDQRSDDVLFPLMVDDESSTTRFAWSADAQEIAFVSVQTGTEKIMVGNSDLTLLREVYSLADTGEDAAHIIDLVWSPDRHSILFAVEQGVNIDLFILILNTGETLWVDRLYQFKGMDWVH